MKPTIAFLTGGYSGEAAVSYLSAATIEKNIDTEKFNFYKIDIRPEGWFYADGNDQLISVDKNDFSITVNNEKITFDAALIGIHGSPGEDGKLQGYFDLLNIPYTSCSCAVSALTFNKRYTTAVAGQSGIHVGKSILLFKSSYTGTNEIIDKLKFPVFVKPNNGGSSIGMSKVNDAGDGLEEAIEKAFREDNQVLVEEFISGREFTIGVFKTKGQIIALPMTEVKSKNKFFDFEAKYQGKSEETTPADADESIVQQVQTEAKKIYEIFNCRGVIRIDFIYHDELNVPFMLEINTIPGQTEASIVPQQIKIYGWELKDLYTALIEECLPA